jgi:hypothetical protein
VVGGGLSLAGGWLAEGCCALVWPVVDGCPWLRNETQAPTWSGCRFVRWPEALALLEHD